MNKLYLLEPGFHEDSVIYEVKLKEISRLPGATLNEVEEELDRLKVTKIIIDAGYPDIIGRIKLGRLVNKVCRRRLPKDQR